MKVCSKCKKEKAEELFCRSKGYCKDCQRIMYSDWRERNRDKRIAYAKVYNKKYLAAKKDIINEKRRNDYEENKSRYTEKNKRYYYKHQEAIKARRSASYASDGEKQKQVRARSKQWATDNPQKAKEQCRNKMKRYSDELKPTYLKRVAKHQGFTDEYIESNPEILEVKKEILKIKRYVKKQTSQKPARVTLQNGRKVRGIGKR